MADFRGVPGLSGASGEEQEDPNNCPSDITRLLALKNLRSATYRNQAPFQETLKGQVSSRYDFCLARSMVGAVYDLALQLGKFDEDLMVRDGEGYNEGPIATPSPTLYFEVGDFLTDLSLNTEGMVEDLFTSNYELLEIRSRQLEVIHLLSQLIASARALKEKFKKLMLYPLRRVVSSSMETDSDSF